MTRTVNIDDLLAVRYVENGRSREEGFDCYGLAIEVCRRFGYEIPDLEEAKVKGYDFFKCMQKGVSLSKVKEVDYPLEPADVVFLKNNVGVLDHIGVCLGNGLMIHCNRYGVHIDKIHKWDKRIGRCYRWL